MSNQALPPALSGAHRVLLSLAPSPPSAEGVPMRLVIGGRLHVAATPATLNHNRWSCADSPTSALLQHQVLLLSHDQPGLTL